MSPKPLLEVCELSVDGRIHGYDKHGKWIATARGPTCKDGMPREPILSGDGWGELWWHSLSSSDQQDMLELRWVPAKPIPGLIGLAKALEDV